ncbi:hypothetical protein RJ640_020327 [Escallonia rubra]|uniref:Uncharacterized protein n=1 Tax=Escallonia rubra TaxID=112253 RepID=A0AA88RUF7_9ASTE|nr:hypothetical protein RJ640_020327 [Escallonia rubra]
MISRFTFSLLLLLLLPQTLTTLTLATTTSARPFNISHYLYPKISDEFRPQPSLFLKDVLEAISEREKWNLEQIRVSEVDVGKVKYGNLQRYEIRVPFGKSELVFELWDEVSNWKRFKEGGDLEALVNRVGPRAVLDSFEIRGPVELRVGGGHELSLKLPLNTSHTGLKRILVAEGITVRVTSAQEVSLFHRSDYGLQVNKSLMGNRERSEFWSFGRSSCMSFRPINILGSASVVAYRTQNPDGFIESAFISKETIELLPEKCYDRHTYRKQECPIDSLSLRIAFLEEVLARLFGNRTSQNAASGLVKSKVRASIIFRFQVEVERNITSNDAPWATMAEWRTKPAVEREWFDVVARLEANSLKPLVIKKVRPFLVDNSSAWSNLMSNMSFTKIPPVLLPPEALTLDVKW